MHAEISTQITAGVNIGRDGRISFPAFVATVTLPPIVDFAACGANEFESKASVLAFTAAVWNECPGSIFRAAGGAGRINGNRRVRGRGITAI